MNEGSDRHDSTDGDTDSEEYLSEDGEASPFRPEAPLEETFFETEYGTIGGPRLHTSVQQNPEPPDRVCSH